MTTDTTPETMAAFVARLGILFTANKVRGPLTCRACRGTNQGNRASAYSCPDCRGTSKRAPRDTDDWRDSAHKWRITMRREGHVMEVPYWTGVGIKTAPTAPEVLDCLASDASSATDPFDSWCADMGYDTDSRKALDTYMECQRIGEKLRALLGSHKEYEALLYSVERL